MSVSGKPGGRGNTGGAERKTGGHTLSMAACYFHFTVVLTGRMIHFQWTQIKQQNFCFITVAEAQ